MEMLMQNVPLQIPSLKPFKGPCHSGTFLGIQLRGSFRLSERLKCQKTCLKDPFLRRLQAWLHNFQLLLGKSWWNEMDPFWGMGILSGPQRGNQKPYPYGPVIMSHYEFQVSIRSGAIIIIIIIKKTPPPELSVGSVHCQGPFQ